MPVDKIPVQIAGFEHISLGGLPAARLTIVTGPAGSAKTVFAGQFLAAGLMHGEPGAVFVTFEESPEDLRRNYRSFGWDVPAWESEGRWAFVDASPQPDDEEIVGEFDLGALLARIEAGIRRTGARRVAIDSVAALLTRFPSLNLIRRELHRIGQRLKSLGVTVVLTAESLGEGSRFGVEDFVADNVIVLRNYLQDTKRRRTIEILKFRGATHQKGEFPFTVSPEEGIMVIPLSAIQLNQESSTQRISTGVEELDRMCGGGFFQDTAILLSGATGTGKTLMATHFLAQGVAQGQRCLLLAFEESRPQLFRSAAGWGIDLEGMERAGLLGMSCHYPETATLEDHLIRIRQAVDSFQPVRLVIDSLSALERIGTQRSFGEFVIALTAFVKQRGLATLLTAASPALSGGFTATDLHLSTITDCIILLRYFEVEGGMKRGLTILKLRGSAHDKTIREFVINNDGLQILGGIQRDAGGRAHPRETA